MAVFCFLLAVDLRGVRQTVIRQFNHQSEREKEVHSQCVKEDADSRSGVVRPQGVEW